MFLPVPRWQLASDSMMIWTFVPKQNSEFPYFITWMYTCPSIRGPFTTVHQCSHMMVMCFIKYAYASEILGDAQFGTEKTSTSKCVTGVLCIGNKCKYYDYSLSLVTAIFYLMMQNIGRNLYSQQQTPHISPSWASYGVSMVTNLEKTDHVITAPHWIGNVKIVTWNTRTFYHAVDC